MSDKRDRKVTVGLTDDEHDWLSAAAYVEGFDGKPARILREAVETLLRLARTKPEIAELVAQRQRAQAQAGKGQRRLRLVSRDGVLLHDEQEVGA